jgi:hypothetical protein
VGIRFVGINTGDGSGSTPTNFGRMHCRSKAKPDTRGVAAGSRKALGGTPRFDRREKSGTTFPSSGTTTAGGGGVGGGTGTILVTWVVVVGGWSALTDDGADWGTSAAPDTATVVGVGFALEGIADAPPSSAAFTAGTAAATAKAASAACFAASSASLRRLISCSRSRRESTFMDSLQLQVTTSTPCGRECVDRNSTIGCREIRIADFCRHWGTLIVPSSSIHTSPHFRSTHFEKRSRNDVSI